MGLYFKLDTNKVDWATPSNIYNAFKERDFIDPVPFGSMITIKDYNFVNKNLFVNPPFNDMNNWVDYLLLMSDSNNIVLLCRCNTDTKWFRKLCTDKNCAEVIFYTGRMKFNDSKTGAPFPICFVHLYKHKDYINLDPFFNFMTEDELLRYIFGGGFDAEFSKEN